jgi:ribosomal-protein-alanine N-acetyltransferase
LSQEVYGLRLNQKYWGQGLATEAAHAIRDDDGLEFGYNRLISRIAHDNIASQTVAMKKGLAYEKNTTKWAKNLRLYVIHQADLLTKDF